jgi:hypothetical protein
MGTPPERSDPEAPSEEEESLTGEVSVKRIEVLNVCLVAAASLASLWISKELALGVVAGGVLMAANFRVIAGVIGTVLRRGSPSRVHVAIYWLKFVGVLVVVGLLVLFFRVDVIGLLVGLSTIVVAVTAEAMLRLVGK